MQTLTTLLSIVILIELWHIAYYCYFKEKYFDYTLNVVTWATSYKKMYKSFLDYSSYYANNEELQRMMPEMRNPMLNMLDTLHGNGRVAISNMILCLVPIRNLMLFLVQQGIETFYWIVSFVFIFIMPGFIGLYICLAITILSAIQTNFNKNNNKVFHVIDSLLCIGIYITCLIAF